MVVWPTHVYVLGAGFSSAAGAPLLREILDQTSEPNKRAVRQLWATPEYKTLTSVLESLPVAERNVEGLFNALASAEFYGSKIGRFRSRTLMDFLVTYLATLIERRTTDSPESLEVYAHFRDDVLDNDEFAIVTFNYDLVADRLATQNAGALHYGFPANSRYRYYGLRNARRRPYVLKLHGSLNWLMCGVCKRVWLLDHYGVRRQGRKCPRPDCPGRLKLLIVPPMWNKEPFAKEIALLWRQARLMLLAAEEIWIIGFSFQPADRLAIDMFREVLANNSGALVQVCNGPNFDLGHLSQLLGRKLASGGWRLEDI